MKREILTHADRDLAQRKRTKGMTCPRCLRCTAQPVDGDGRTLICTECEALVLVGAANEAYPAGIRKGRRCAGCGRCSVAVRSASCWGTSVTVFACRNPKCGLVGVYPEESISIQAVDGASGDADRDVVPLMIPQGISDLLDDVRR